MLIVAAFSGSTGRYSLFEDGSFTQFDILVVDNLFRFIQTNKFYTPFKEKDLDDLSLLKDIVSANSEVLKQIEPAFLLNIFPEQQQLRIVDLAILEQLSRMSSPEDIPLCEISRPLQRAIAIYTEHADFFESECVSHYSTVEIPFAITFAELTQSGIQRTGDGNLEKIQNQLEDLKEMLYRALKMANPRFKKHFKYVAPADFYKVATEYLSFINIQLEISNKDDLERFALHFPAVNLFYNLDKINRFYNCGLFTTDSKIIRPEYRIVSDRTLRCYSHKPNIMGVPRIFRPLITAHTIDSVIIECDYKAMDACVMAGMSGDRNLIADYTHGDVYSNFAQRLNLPNRDVAKQLFLGISYGLGEKRLAHNISSAIGRVVTREDARRLKELFFNHYSTLRAFFRGQEIELLSKGSVKTLSGMKRSRKLTASKLEYKELNWAHNFPIQSTAATLFKQTVIKLADKKMKGFKLLLPFHDSIVFEVDRTMVDEARAFVEHCMKSTFTEAFKGVIIPKTEIKSSCSYNWEDSDSVSLEQYMNEVKSSL